MLYCLHEGDEAELGGSWSDWSSLEVMITQGTRQIPLSNCRRISAFAFSSGVFLIEETANTCETARAKFYINENGEFVFQGNAEAIKWLEEQVHMFKRSNPHVHAHIDSISFESVLDDKSLELVFYMEEETCAG